MAVVMMGGPDDEEKPMFHDFLGMSCGVSPSPAPAPVASDLGSERQGMNNSEVFHFHGRKNAISEPEASNTFSGRKRSNLDSAFMGLIRDTESSRFMKMIGKEVVGERSGRLHDDEMLFSMQLPPRPTSSLILHPPGSSRPDSLVSRWERTVPINPGPMVHYPSRLGQIGTYMDKLSSSYSYRDASAGATLISQAAADEGSRTGIKGSGYLKVANPISGAAEKNSTAVLPSSTRPRAPQIIDLESSTLPGRHSIASTSRQMTIFYGGQAHVFDDVHPNKADVIMALAGSNGGSWSTTYSPKKSSLDPPTAEAKIPCRDAGFRGNNSPLLIQGNLDGGLRQVERVPVPIDLPSLIPGCLQGGRATGDARQTMPAAEPDMEGRGNVS